MLRNTFLHIPGIGPKTERLLWENGCRCWDDFRPPYPAGLTVRQIRLIEGFLADGPEHFLQEPHRLAAPLPAAQLWRLFPHFRPRTAFLDIETTGLEEWESTVTVIGLFDGTTMRHYVHGRNLDDFVQDVRQFEVLVTYNGKCFDIPVLERWFGISLDQVQIDLRYILHSLGYKGGLKGCEKRLGLDREGLEGVDGYFAVLLWQEFRRTGNPRALEALLAYNLEDTVNLETLMVHAYNLHLAATPFADTHCLALPEKPWSSLRPDPELIGQLRERLAFLKGAGRA